MSQLTLASYLLIFFFSFSLHVLRITIYSHTVKPQRGTYECSPITAKVYLVSGQLDDLVPIQVLSYCVPLKQYI